MQIDRDIALELAFHEAVVRQAYKDSVGIWTWSVGITSASGHNVERYINKPQSLRKCFEVYAWLLERYASAVRAEFAGHDLTKAQFAAALSFHWNTGAIRSATWPELWKQGDLAGARASFMQWRRPAAIIPRREKEAALFFDGVWSNDGTITEYTRVQANGAPDWSSAVKVNVKGEFDAVFRSPDTVPDPTAPIPTRSTGGGTGAAAGVAGAGSLVVAADQVMERIDIAQDEPSLLVFVAVGVALVAAGIIAWRWLQDRKEAKT